ncbi:sulfotransferase [uncultured Desulfobacter sp.]|uniref:tetratricopeptide repeat-containing sulfotransferase family protein n=1 Tax=uncultured Desulfobacter sp. TaxID=240139 RepID=UPI002AAB5A80|nr:sulfotransferase [uncultured Desulfobacter sp.]
MGRTDEKRAQTNVSCRELWQAVLEHRTADVTALCSALSVPAPEDKTVISLLVPELCRPSALQGILGELNNRERTSTGWEALFFGLARANLGQLFRALQLFDTATEFEPCRAHALAHLAGLYLLLDQRDMVEETIREGLSLDGSLGEFHLVRARMLLQDRDYDGAESEMALAKQKGCFSALNQARFELELLIVRDMQPQAIAAAVRLLREGTAWLGRDAGVSLGLGVLIACGALDEADNFLDQALEKDSGNLVLLSHRAEIAALTGRFRVAAHAVNQALAQDGDNIQMLHKKASMAGQGVSHDQALKALDRIIDLTRDLSPPDRAVYLSVYGDIYLEQDDLEKAEAAYNDALAVDEKCIPAMAGLSHVLTILGRMEEACAAQNKVYRIAPVRAMQLMINSDRIPEEEALIQRMEKMAKSPSVHLPMRASLNFSLAKVWQKRMDHDAAMAYADKANEIVRKFVSYDPENEARHVDRIMARMSRAFFDNRKGYGTECRLPIYILGMPRSGTTLVEQIIGGHSKVFPGGELGMMPAMWRRLTLWEHRMGSPYRNMPDCILDLTLEHSRKFADKVEGEYRELMPEGVSEKHITDKLPHNFKNVGLIKLLYPKAKIIYCRRSPGGIALSNYFTDYKARHGGMGFAYHKEWIGKEIANCHRLMAHWSQIFDGGIHIIDYDELVENPEPLTRKMFTYLELDWEEKVMAFSTLRRPVKTASVTQVRQPMYTSSKDKWRYYEAALRNVFAAFDSRQAEPEPEPLPLPCHEQGLFFQGMDLLRAGENAEAESVFKKLLEFYPRHAAAMHMLGVAYSNQGKILPAHKCMKRSIQLHPGNHTWYGNMAIILDHMRRPDEAAEMREKGKKISGQNGYIPRPNPVSSTQSSAPAKFEKYMRTIL